MKFRCDNPRCPFYANYGGRGISYEPRRASFTEFLGDMRATWFNHAELHSIDTNGNYEPNNVVWLSKSDHAKLHATPEKMAKASEARWAHWPYYSPAFIAALGAALAA